MGGVKIWVVIVVSVVLARHAVAAPVDAGTDATDTDTAPHSPPAEPAPRLPASPGAPAALPSPMPPPAPPVEPLDWPGDEEAKTDFQQSRPVPDLSPARLSGRYGSVELYGLGEYDVIHDSTQSHGDGASNLTLARPGTVFGDNDQLSSTLCDSRVGVRASTSEARRVRGLFVLELGPELSPTTGDRRSCSDLHVRHGYLALRSPIVDVLVGRTYGLLGWGGKGFYPSTLAFLGITGEIYHRQPQIRLSKTLSSSAAELEIAGAALRPVQKAGGYPDIEAGVRLAFNKWTGVRQQAYGQPGIGAMSLGVSAIGRHFEVANYIENPSTTVSGTGYGIAANAFIPVIPASSAKDRGNSLSLTGEYSRGTGIADMYSDLTGGLLFPSLPNSMDRMDPTNPPPVYTPNIDSGIVTFDGDRRLRTCNWEGFVANLQYYLPIAGGRVWVAATHSEVKSTNIQEITPLAGWGGIFTRSWYNDASLFVAITNQIQIGVAFQRTHQWLGPEIDPMTKALVPVTATNYRSELGMNMFF